MSKHKTIDQRIGELCKFIREFLDLTQADAGKKIGVCEGTIRRWENGQYTPAGMIAYAEALGLKRYELDTIAHNGPTASLSRSARGFAAVYWGRERG